MRREGKKIRGTRSTRRRALRALVDSVVVPLRAQATASGTQTFTTPGQFDFIVPQGVTQVQVSAVGAGGGRA